MATHKDSIAVTDYLNARDRSQRLGILTRLRDAGQYLPLSLAEDVLLLDLGADEKVAVLETTGSNDGRALEHFLTAHLLDWPQDLAAAAVRLWSQKTDHLLWFRVLEACRSPHVPQRVFYTIVDHAFRAGGVRVVTAAAAVEGLATLSPAFHGLTLHRAVQWGLEQPQLLALAEAIVVETAWHIHPENKALPSAIAYLARFAPAMLNEHARRAEAGPWRDQLRAIFTQIAQIDKQLDQIGKLIARPPKSRDKLASQLDGLWPPLWSRHHLTAEHVAFALRDVDPLRSGAATQTFGGIGDARLGEALATLDDDAAFAAATGVTLGYFPFPTAPGLVELVKRRLAAAPDPGVVLGGLPLRLRVEMTEDQSKAGGKATAFALVKQEEAQSLAGKAPRRVVFSDYRTEDVGRPYRDGAETAEAVAARKRFFDVVYRGETRVAAPTDNSVWSLLLDAWQRPAASKLAAVAQAARQIEGLFRLCYVNTLGRFQGHDQAALKLLDFIRSKEEDDLRAVMQALGGIGTPRAAQEMVAALTRPNMSAALQLEACGILAKLELGNLQNELRSAMKDLTTATSAAGGVETTGWEVRDAIAGLLVPVTATPQGAAASEAVSDQQLDLALGGKIRHYRELSSEVKRALRTSQFFHRQVTGASAPESIDLSPVIDMQYKALELLFRETFEEICSRLIHRGVLQRRLDVIGYARPIPRAMDEFEAYVAALPVVREIPFFSKFKLRKMLRAICQFRPGKRFTLDGLKAFALFFLCFGRHECRYGLAGLFPLGFASDHELFDFCKALHIMQDFRNRAAHEGFHPDASSDIDGIWRQTAEIVQTMFKTKAFVEAGAAAEFAPKNRSTPIIEKKVS